MRKLTVVLIVCLATKLAGAQVLFGLKAGLNASNLVYTGNNVAGSLHTRFGFSGGLQASIHLVKSLSLQPELVFSAQGNRANDEGTPVKLAYDYLNMPVLVKFKSRLGFFLETGPQIGYLLSSRFHADDQSQDNKKDSQPVDFSWVFGMGYQLPKINLGLDIRYNWGLSNNNRIINDGTIKNSVFQFGIYYYWF